MKRTAIVFGATGLTGSNLAEELTRCEAYDKILIFTRRKSKAAVGAPEQAAVQAGEKAVWNRRFRKSTLKL